MQNLPTIIAVIIAAIAIIAVLLWRIHPQAQPNSDISDKRLAEEMQKAIALQAKLDANESSVREAIAAASSEKATSNALAAKAMDAEQKLENAKLELKALSDKYNSVQPTLAKAIAEKEGADLTKNDLANRLAVVTQRYEDLIKDHETTIARAATAKADVENAKLHMIDMEHVIEGLQTTLTAEREKLATALAKQTSDEDAASKFENISHAILKETMVEAKQEIEALAKSLQKSSGEELNKHAEKVALTLEPLQAKLLAYDDSIKRMAKDSSESHGSLTQQIAELQKAERSLHDQAQALTYALSASPKVKGMYGELMLKQLVEFVGMQEKCHFEEQAGRDTAEGRKIPDLIISLPNGQKLVVDAKAVMDACVEAYQAKNEDQRNILLKKHCANVRSRVADLSSKNYFSDHQDAVEMVVLFLPAENLYSAAVENDPTLTEDALRQKIIVCGPNSLMMLLKVANQLWRRASIEQEADDIKKCGEAIYKAASDFVDKFAGIGNKIRALETEYNNAVGTFEARLLPAGKRMNTFTSLIRNKEMGDVEILKDNVREFKDATLQLVTQTQKLPGLLPEST